MESLVGSVGSSPVSGAAISALVRHQVDIQRLLRERESIDVRAFELARPETIAQDLQPVVARLLAGSQKAFAEVLDTCEAASSVRHLILHEWSTTAPERARRSTVPPADKPFELAVDTAVTEMKGSLLALEEVAFLAQLELRERGERLRSLLPRHGSAVLIDECDSSLRRLRKALSAVDVAIASAGGKEPASDFTTELQISIDVRRTYARFRRDLLADGDPTHPTLRARLRLAGTQIAMLVGHPAYPDMRVRDRLLLREIQARILAWLRDMAGIGVDAGMQIWKDLATFAEMLTLVNRREELLKHDGQTLRRASESLRSSRASDGVSDATWDAVRSLEGLDAKLDAMLAVGTATNGELLEVLTSICELRS